MALSIFNIFKIGIGPSSSHTVGPMRAANFFLKKLSKHNLLSQTDRIAVELYGSLSATGVGHCTDIAIIGGLENLNPKSVDPNYLQGRVKNIIASKVLKLNGEHEIPFSYKDDLIFMPTSLPLHANGMKFLAYQQNKLVYEKIFYSIGGGFIVGNKSAHNDNLADELPDNCQICSADSLLQLCNTKQQTFAQTILEYELTLRPLDRINTKLDKIWQTMDQAINKGISTTGILPGSLQLKRVAPQRFKQLTKSPTQALRQPLAILDWVNLYALAVNEENAAGGRVVTAPTNGAAGIIPAVIKYYEQFCPEYRPEGIRSFLLTAGAVGLLYKLNASISGAEVGCQGEVGVACSMAAAGLTEVLGGSANQIENAAEIAMEHNLGLTCDPIAGLVQIPCIERNSMAAVKAINAAKMALEGDGHHYVSLANVMKTMKETGLDMQSKYKETSQGGLAVNVTIC